MSEPVFLVRRLGQSSAARQAELAAAALPARLLTVEPHCDAVRSLRRLRQAVRGAPLVHTWGSDAALWGLAATLGRGVPLVLTRYDEPARWFARGVEELPLPLALPDENPNVEPVERRVVLVGDVNRFRQWEWFIRAYHALTFALPGMSLVVIGDGPALPRLRERMRAFVAFETPVRWVTETPDLASELAAASVVWSPLDPYPARLAARLGRPVAAAPFGDVAALARATRAAFDAPPPEPVPADFSPAMLAERLRVRYDRGFAS